MQTETLLKLNTILSHCAGLAVVFIWSGWITLSRYGMQTALTPVDLTMLRYVTALICVVPVMFYLSWRRHSLVTWLVVGLGVGFPYTLLTFYGSKCSILLRKNCHKKQEIRHNVLKLTI